ncbi:gamma-butyrobetaine hydroxylase family protein [Phyllobacterium sp. K27]
MTDAWPKELRVSKDRKSLSITFDNGERYDLSAELLRVASPSAEVQGHSPEQRVTVPGKINVEIAKMEPIGNYAVRITFDDMHDTGLFSWDYLIDLGRNRDMRWQAYLDELTQKGLAREPVSRKHS